MLIRKGLQPTLQNISPRRGGLSPPYGRENKDGDRERIIFHLDLDAFFAQVEEVADPRLKGKPVFVVGHSMTSGVVLTSNYVARQFGVKTGMPLREARKLCPAAVLVPADCSKYSDTSEQIFAYLAHYTPLMEIFSIDEAFLDVTHLCRGQTPLGGQSPKGVCPLFLAREIKSWVLKNFGLTISVGIAPNKLLAKLASGWEKPDGLFRILPAEIPKFLQTLPIEELCGIGSRLKFHLNQMGVRTAGELGSFPEMELFRRFGVMGLVLKRMGQGVDHSPVLSVDHSEPVKSIGHSYTLTRVTRDREAASRYLLWLSEKVARRLRRLRLEGQIVHTTVRFSDFETFSRQKNLSFFLEDGKTIFQYAWKIFTEIDRPVADATGLQDGVKTRGFAASRPSANALGLQSGSQTGRLSASGPDLFQPSVFCEARKRSPQESRPSGRDDVGLPNATGLQSGRPVRLLGVSVSGLRLAGREPWLFESFDRRRSLLEAVDAVNDKYGEFTLRSAFLNFPDDRKIASRPGAGAPGLLNGNKTGRFVASRALQLFGSGRH